MTPPGMPVVTKLAYLGPDPVEAGRAELGLRLADGSTAKYVLSTEVAEQMFHFLSAVHAPKLSRPNHHHEATDAHADHVSQPTGFLLHFETTDYADQTIRVSEALLIRLKARINRALREWTP